MKHKLLCFQLLQVRNFYTGKDFKGDPPLLTKIAAGLTTGAIGIMVASPTDLVKVEQGLPVPVSTQLGRTQGKHSSKQNSTTSVAVLVAGV
jgi:hypothetical protein